MIRLWAPLWFCLLGSLPLGTLSANPTTSQQTHFATQRTATSMGFGFAWRDKQGQPQNLQFFLPLSDLARGAQEFTLLDNTAMQAEAIQAIQNAVATANTNLRVGTPQQGLTLPRGVSITVLPAPNGYKIKVSGPALALQKRTLNPLMAQLNAVGDKAITAYLARHGYIETYDTHIMPNHPRIAARYAPALAPVTQAVLGQTVGMETRARINWLLGWLQTIPYNTLQNRTTSNGAGFQTPYGLFLGNKGDCDTKSVALAALLRGLYPTLKLAMIYTPGHAFIGVGLPQGPHDFALNLKGTVYVLAEPTGPRQLALGEVAPEALSHLKQSDFTFREIP